MVSTSDYKLKGTDTQKERRNFSGYEKHQFYTEKEVFQGDRFGTTNTEKKTTGVSTINTKKGKQHGSK